MPQQPQNQSHPSATTPEQADLSHVDAHGAVDLSGTGGAPGPASQGAPARRARAGEGARAQDPAGQGDQAAPEPTVRLDVPLITTADESTFETVMSTSRTVPVIVLLWSSRSLAARDALDTMEGVARDSKGAFQLVEIDTDTAPAIAQAFQVQTTPTAVALLGGRPVPLFQGSVVREQVLPVVSELVRMAAQVGVTGAVAVSAEDTAAPVPEEHRPAIALEAAGDLQGALDAWSTVAERNPRDETAKSEVARLRLAVRSSGAHPGDPAAHADALFQSGDVAAAFGVLLDLVARSQGDARDDARVRLLDLFRVAGNTPEVRDARRRLSALLMV